MTGVWTPQWLYQHVTLPASTTIRIEPSAFKNDTPWPMFLKWFSLAGIAVQDGAGEYQSVYGGIARRLRFELSITQKGDINYAAANTQTMFCAHRRRMLINSRYDFNPAFPLGPDEGVVVEVTNLWSGGDYSYPSITFSGLRVEPNFGQRPIPAMLGAGYQGTIGFNDSVTLDSGDLYNNGEEPFWIRSMGIHGYTSTTNYANVGVGIKLNPNSGLPWVPQNDFIPVGNLCPLSSYLTDVSDEGPSTYMFPRGTELRPRQRLTVEVTNLSTSEQKFGLCLHGVLEVQ